MRQPQREKGGEIMKRWSIITAAHVEEIYRRRHAIWEFDYGGDSRAPHAALTQELCADSYINSELVMHDPLIVELLAYNLVDRIKTSGRIIPVDWVLGSSYGSITFSFEVAKQFGVRHGFTKKDPREPTRMVWDGTIESGARVLRVEELVTTGGTASKVEHAVSAANPGVRFLREVATVFWRPPADVFPDDSFSIIALVRRDMQTWSEHECPLCRGGSPRLRPRAHWRKFISRSS